MTNTGEASAIDVRVCDAPLPGLRLVSTPGFQRVGSRACITIPNLGVGKHTTLTLTGRITAMASSFAFNRASAQARNAPLVRASAVVRVIGGIRCPSGGVRPAAAPNC